MPFERSSPQAWSVAALVRALADTLFARFGVVTVQGEISGFTRAASGHCYFVLRDETAQLRCVMFRQRAALADFDPRDGQRVEIKAAVGLYEPRGELQLTVESMRPTGQGALLEEFLRLKSRLQAEGLFDAARKRALPAYPRVVGIITSPQAAALHDVLVTLGRRSPQVRVVIYPASVQGVSAPADLLRALQAANSRREVDVLLLVRGGGAMEDLWAFNDEQLARALAASHLPVVCGVGHETDFTMADFAADVRAATPTAAAELCAPALADLRMATAQLRRALAQAAQRTLARELQRLDRLHLRLPSPERTLHAALHQWQDMRVRMQAHVQSALARSKQAQMQWASRLRMLPSRDRERRHVYLADLERRFRGIFAQCLRDQELGLDGLQRRLALLNPAATLQRGYCLAWGGDGRILEDAAALHEGQALVLATANSAVSLDIGRTHPIDHPLAALMATESRDSS